MNREVAAEAGLWYEPDDPISGLARQIQRLIDEPETRDALRAAASERAQQFYTWEHIVDQYERLFQEMVRARAGRNA
jgi:glycosyltransferase involved in cell wall biosynthesis